MSGLESADELIEKLNIISSKMQTEIVEKAIAQGVQIVRREAVLLCPVDTGELRQSIKTSVETAGDEVNGITYTNKEYAAYVEFGTGPKGEENHSGISPKITPSYTKHGWSYKNDAGEWIYTNGQPAQPFMYPALKNNEDKVKKRVKEVISEELRKLV